MKSEYEEIEGNLITLAKQGVFDVIVQGVNCWCRQKSGLAPQMVEAFQTDKFPLEFAYRAGEINKLGQIDFKYVNEKLAVVNAYTQYKIKKFNDQDYHYTTTENPFDYEALTLCMRKINDIFKGQHIGLPYVIGCGLAGGDIERVLTIIKNELSDVRVTIVKLPE
jgi:O-acetyl-ADP-ribose deacetylase (regulator of RNase III)